MPDDPSDLRERVRELEQTVSEQQETIQKLMPSRRAVLSGLVGAGAGAAGVYAGTDSARAQSAAGDVGTSSDPVDTFAYDLDVQNGASFNGSDLTDVGALDAGDLTIGDGSVFVDAESGKTSNLSYPGAASDGTVDTGQAKNHTISFNNTFNTPPAVFIEPTRNVDGTFAEVADIRTTGFDLKLVNYSTDDRSSLARAFSYLAVLTQ